MRTIKLIIIYLSIMILTINVSAFGMEKQSESKCKYYSKKAVVLTYHHISNNAFSAITIKPSRFKDDLQMLKEKGFNVISLQELLELLDRKQPLPPDAVVITFDDGIESFYKYAYPELKKYNMPAANFIITSRTEKYKKTNAELNPLSPEEIKEMYMSGIIDIESHTHDCHDMAEIDKSNQKMGGKLAHRIYINGKKETMQQYTERIKEDLTISRDIIYKYISVYPNVLCFPFGQYNKTVIDTAKECGFKYFVTTEKGNVKQEQGSNKIKRIRAGDAKLNSNKLFENIVKCGQSK